jgi:hypothetical protein
MIYRMSFVSLDDDEDRYCCSVVDDLANGDDTDFYLEKSFIKVSQKDGREGESVGKYQILLRVPQQNMNRD